MPNPAVSNGVGNETDKLTQHCDHSIGPRNVTPSEFPPTMEPGSVHSDQLVKIFTLEVVFQREDKLFP
jgi:hypothetical protein